MTEQEYLTCNDPAVLLRFLTGAGQGNVWVETGQHGPSDRKLRLFACACCRYCKKAGDYDQQELTGEKYGLSDLAWATAWTEERAWAAIARPVLASILRDIFGNPWKPLNIMEQVSVSELCPNCHGTKWSQERINGGMVEDVRCPACDGVGIIEEHREEKPPWLTSHVIAFAQRIYDERSFDDMPVLADALEEARCCEEELLRHLRSNSLHVRGCWSLDAILGKE